MKLPGVAAAAQRGAFKPEDELAAGECAVLEHGRILEEDAAAMSGCRGAHEARLGRASAMCASTAMRTATPFATCLRIADCGPSATSDVDLDAAIHRSRMHHDRFRACARRAARPSARTRGGRRRGPSARGPLRARAGCAASSRRRRRRSPRPATQIAVRPRIPRHPASSGAARRCGSPGRRALRVRDARNARRANAGCRRQSRPTGCRSAPCSGGSSAHRAGPGSDARNALRLRRSPRLAGRPGGRPVPGAPLRRRGSRIRRPASAPASRSCRAASRPSRATTVPCRG